MNNNKVNWEPINNVRSVSSCRRPPSSLDSFFLLEKSRCLFTDVSCVQCAAPPSPLLLDSFFLLEKNWCWFNIVHHKGILCTVYNTFFPLPYVPIQKVSCVQCRTPPYPLDSLFLPSSFLNKDARPKCHFVRTNFIDQTIYHFIQSIMCCSYNVKSLLLSRVVSPSCCSISSQLEGQ